MVIVKNGQECFDEKLVSLIKNQSNDEVISMLKKVPVHRLADCNQRSLLHLAALHNNPVIAQYLIDRRCEVDATDSFGDTPFNIAISSSNADVAKIFLKANAKIGTFNNYRNVLMRMLINRAPNNLEIIESVFAKITSRCSDNNDIVKKLVERECPLPGVIFLKNAELTKLLLNQGYSANDRLFESKETALHLAVELSDVENVKVLVEHGADVNATDSKDCTPLHRFQLGHDLDILRLLLDRGASPITTQTLNISEPAFMSRILSRGDSHTISVLMPYIDLSKSYRDYGHDVYPLHDLAWNKNDDIVDLLRGKTFNANSRNHVGWTPLDIAAVSRRMRMVQFLLENGANPNNVDVVGNSTLHFIMSGSLKETEAKRGIVELLLQYGADALFIWKMRDRFFHANGSTHFILVQPLLAHLAMIGALNKYVRRKIKANKLYKNGFENFKLQIELMKNTVMYESVTMYSLLSECEDKVATLSRIPEFVSNYEMFVKNNKNDIDSYYISTIRLRVDKTLSLVQMKEKVAGILCEMMNLPYSMVGVIGYNVAKYLPREDLDNVLQV